MYQQDAEEQEVLDEEEPAPSEVLTLEQVVKQLGAETAIETIIKAKALRAAHMESHTSWSGTIAQATVNGISICLMVSQGSTVADRKFTITSFSNLKIAQQAVKDALHKISIDKEKIF